jgi:hypothetical protein
MEAVGTALDVITATFADDRREFSARLGPVVGGNSELQEPAALKRAGLAGVITDSPRNRGVQEPTASLAAELGVRALYHAFDQWADPVNQQTFTELTRHALDELRAATAVLGQDLSGGSGRRKHGVRRRWA